MSSMSVMLTQDEDLAREVYSLASTFGRTSLYKVELLKSTNQGD